MSFSYYMKTLLTLALIFALYKIILRVHLNQKQLKRYDPYEVLEVDSSASVREIKKAYRQLVLLYHPDKCKTTECATKFIQISNAHECLTDDTKREICAKFGNPEGSHSTKVSLALPSALKDKENNVLILVSFFLILLIFVPIIAMIIHGQLSQNNEFGFHNENGGFFVTFINEQMTVKGIPEILAHSYEFRSGLQNTSQEQNQLISEMFQKKLPEDCKKSIKRHPNFNKAYILLQAYLNGIKVSHVLEDQLNFVLQVTAQNIQGIINLIPGYSQNREAQ